MALHVYAYVAAAAAGTAPVGLIGADDRPVTAVPAGAVAAVVSEHEVVPADRAAALAHAAVVQVLTERTATVPVRFGHVAADPGALRAAIGADAEHLTELLARLGHRAEIAVHATLDEGAAPPPPRDAGGRAYLEARAAQERAARAAEAVASERLDAVVAALEHLAVDTRRVRGSAGPEACFLVEADAVATFRAAVARVVGGEVGLRLSGPWPPYSFATPRREVNA